MSTASRAQRRAAARERREQAIVGHLLHSAADHLPLGATVYGAARLRPRPWLLRAAAIVALLLMAAISLTRVTSHFPWSLPIVLVAQLPRWFLTALVASSDGITVHRCRSTTVGRAVAEVSPRDVQRELHTSRSGRCVSVWTVNGKRCRNIGAAEEHQMDMILRSCEREPTR